MSSVWSIEWKLGMRVTLNSFCTRVAPFRVSSLVSQQARSEEQLARSFSKLIFEGKVKPATCLLDTHSRGGTLNLDSQAPVGDSSDELASVCDVLIAKHPKGQPLKASAVVEPTTAPQTPHLIMFEGIDANHIHSMPLKTDGAAGPSGIDAYGWRRLLVSFQRESTTLCEAVAMVARQICQQFVDPAGLQAFTACRWWLLINVLASDQSELGKYCGTSLARPS